MRNVGSFALRAHAVSLKLHGGPAGRSHRTFSSSSCVLIPNNRLQTVWESIKLIWESPSVAKSSPNEVQTLFKQCQTLQASLSRSPQDSSDSLDHDTESPEALRLPHMLSSPNLNAKNIAVLGGGITGLSTAFNLARNIPNAKITVFEKADRLGGWVDSEILHLDDGEVVFEWGPRSLRPDIDGAGIATLQLLSNLRLNHEYLGTRKQSSAARNRFIYYPDHLVRMPSPYQSALGAILGLVKGLLTEPVFSGLLTSTLKEPTIRTRPAPASDESVGDFIQRRFGQAAADNLASALFHGIYAGDIYSLSMRTCLPKLWYLETRDPDGSGIIAEQLDLALRGRKLSSLQDLRFNLLTPPPRELARGGDKHLYSKLEEWSKLDAIYTLKNGLETLIRGLRNFLSKQLNVTIKTSTNVSALYFDRAKKRVFVGTDAQSSSKGYDYVVSTLRPGIMRSLTTPPEDRDDLPPPLPTRLFQNVDKAVTVMVVNLFYKNPNLLRPERDGFGYLIPRSVEIENNPERALGVIFGSSFAGGGKKELHSTYRERLIGQKRDEIDMMKSICTKAANPDFEHSNPRISQRPEVITSKIQLDISMSERELAELIADKNPPASGYDKLCQDTAAGTKLAVMLGGHWWDGWTETDYPSEQEAIDMAKRVLHRHLGVTDEPVLAKARLQRDCIPQYPPGYRDHMAEIHQRLLMGHFQGRLKVAGPWWQGAVGMNDSVRKAREVSMAIENGWDDRTGLEDFVGREKWVLWDKRTGTVDIDPMCE